MALFSGLGRLAGLFSSGAGALPIGLDFAAQAINLMQLSRAADGTSMQVHAAASIPYPCEREKLLTDPALLKPFVRAALASSPFVGRRVYCALAPADVRIIPLTVHVGPGQNEQQLVARAVREHLGGALDQSVIDYYQVRSLDGDGPDKQVLVAVAQQTRVMAYLEVLRSAGLDPLALDIGPVALARLLAALQNEDYDQSILLINFGIVKSYLTVVWGRRLMIDREIDFGEMQMTDKLAQSLGLTPAVALSLLREHGIGARERGKHANGAAEVDIGRTIGEILHPEFTLLSEELGRTQVYVASRTRGSSISRVYVNGSAAGYPNIQDRIAELVALPVELLNPFNAFTGTSALNAGNGLQQGIALAAGLALRGACGG